MAPALSLALLALPVLCGLGGTILPAFGYLPALGRHSLSLEPFRALLDTPGIGWSAFQTFYVGLASTALSLVIVAAFVAAWYGRPSFRLLQAFVSPLLAVPHAAVALGFAFMVAPSGFLVRLVSPELTGWVRPPDALIVNDPLALSLIAGLVVKEVPFLLLVTLAALPQVAARRSLLLTAGLGYGQMSGFLIAVWPMIYRQIRLAVFAVLAFSSSVVDVAIILGPNVPSTLPVRLVQWMNDAELSQRLVACAGACLQIAVTATLLAVWLCIERLCGMVVRSFGEGGRRFARDRAPREAARLVMAASVLVVIGGLAMMAVWSIAGLWTYPDALPKAFSLRSWMQALPTATDHIQTTIIIGASATLLSVCLVLGCLACESETGRTGGQRALWLLYLPLLVPQVGFLFGLQFLLVSVNADAALGSVILVHMVFVLPYVFLSLAPPWRSHDIRHDRVAACLGKSPRTIFWRVRVPMLLRPILAAAAVGFAVSVSQYLPTLLIGAGRFSTITTEAVALGAGGNRRVVGVYAFLQMVLPFIAFVMATAIPALLFRHRRAISPA